LEYPVQHDSNQIICTAPSSIGNNSIHLQGNVPMFTTNSTVSIGTVFFSFPTNKDEDKQSTPSLWNVLDQSEFIGTSGIRRNHNRNTFNPNKTNDWILLHPTTAILLCTNVALAFLFYYKQVPPEHVSISYVKIIDQYEYWRCWSGSFAHFEPWHLMFNMSSTFSLGSTLESIQQFMSIPFLWINACLMFWTTMMEMALFYCRIRWVQKWNHPESDAIITDLKSRQSVGFSGVLFAWMVVDCLERDQTCPVPFFPDACFSTQSLAGGWIQFNAGPFVSLLVCQCLIPRASFVGHLSGILCGFIWHWKILPTNLAWSPEVLIPLFLLLDLWLIQKIVSFKHGFRCEGGMERESWVINTRNTDHDDDTYKLKQSALEYGKLAMATASCLCFITFNILGTICLSQSIIAILFYIVADVYHKNSSLHILSTRSKLGTVYQGLVVSLVISIVSNASSIGSVLGGWIHVRSEYNLLFGPVITFLVMLLLVIINYAALWIVCGIFHDINQSSSGAFSHIFGWILRNSHEAMEIISHRLFYNQHVIHER